MKFLDGYHRVSAIFLIVAPRVLDWLGYPIGGEDLAPIVNGLGDLAAAVLVLVSKLRHPSA